MTNWPYWFEIAVVCGLTAVGSILMGHWEEGTPKWRRVAKLAVLCGAGVLVSATAGRGWFLVMLGALGVAVILVHAWWLPRQGINGWTGEPREKYHVLRGWKRPSGKDR